MKIKLSTRKNENNINALLLQVVGGSVAVVGQTSTADIPEGRACSGDSSREGKRCFGCPQRDKTAL